MEQFCISLEQAKRLKELGFEKFSRYYWYEVQSVDKGVLTFFNNIPSWLDHRPITEYPAYHVGELGEMLPDAFTDLVYRGNGTWYIETWDRSIALLNLTADGHPTEAQARGALLIYLIENKLI